MLPYFSFDHFQIGPVIFYSWGFFVGLGFLTGYILALWQARRKGVSPDKIIFLSIAIFLGAALGSRLLFLLQSPMEFLNDISLLWHIDQGGMMIWGGILGGVVFAWGYLVCFPLYKGGLRGIFKSQRINPPARGLATSFKKGGINPPPASPDASRGGQPSFLKEGVRKNNFWQFADILAAPAALGIAIGRLGCFLVNDHQGAATNLPWGILWPDGVSRHPVALYEILAMLGLFFVLLWWQRHSLSVIPAKAGIQKPWIPAQGRDDKLYGNDKSEGLLFLILLISYAVLRFFLDFLRASAGPLADPQWFGLFTSQWISLLVIFGAFSIFYVRFLKNANS